MTAGGEQGGDGTASDVLARTVLTPIECRVVEALCEDGAGNVEIARRLPPLTRCAVINALLRARRKADVPNRTALALWWIRTGRYGATDDRPSGHERTLTL